MSRSTRLRPTRIPPTEPQLHPDPRSPVGPEAYGEFLNAVFDEWFKTEIGEVYVQMFDVALASWHGEPPGLCIFSETCGLA